MAGLVPFQQVTVSSEADVPPRTNWLLVARRQAFPVISGVLLGLIIGAIYVASIAPQYTATAVLFVDTRKVRTIQDAYDFPPTGFDPNETGTASVAAILTTDEVVRSIADKLRLVNDPTFFETDPSILQSLIGSARDQKSRPDNNYDRVLASLKSNLSVSRVQRSHVMNITYRAGNGEAAAKVANAFADAYIADQLTAKYAATRQAASWLSERLEESKRGVLDADLEVQRFKAKMVGRGPVSDEALATLRELESKSASLRTLHATLLQRYQETLQQESFPISDGRVVASARNPGSPNNPPTWRLLALFTLGGGLAGAALGALREARDRGFRTSNQVRTDLGLELLGMLPWLPPQRQRRSRPLLENGGAASDIQSGRLPAPTNGRAGYGIGPREMHYWETLGSVKVALDLVMSREKNAKLIGITSVFPCEGKSTTAKNLAALMAASGADTLLIDADLRNRGLSRGVIAEASEGIWDATMSGKPIDEVIVRDPDSKLAILPAGSPDDAALSSEWLMSPRMQGVLEHAHQNFSRVLIDLPPLGLFVDARALAPQIDAFIVVLEWGKSERRIVQEMLAREELVREKCLGVVFNKVDFERLNLYEDYGSRDYYLHQYSRTMRPRVI
jgi:capsular exopolysaccharide synthesis family protein